MGKTPQHRQRSGGRGRKGGARAGPLPRSRAPPCRRHPTSPPQTKARLPKRFVPTLRNHSGQMRPCARARAGRQTARPGVPLAGSATRHMAWSARAEVLRLETRSGPPASGNKGRGGQEVGRMVIGGWWGVRAETGLVGASAPAPPLEAEI